MTRKNKTIDLVLKIIIEQHQRATDIYYQLLKWSENQLDKERLFSEMITLRGIGHKIMRIAYYPTDDYKKHFLDYDTEKRKEFKEYKKLHVELLGIPIEVETIEEGFRLVEYLEKHGIINHEEKRINSTGL